MIHHSVSKELFWWTAVPPAAGAAAAGAGAAAGAAASWAKSERLAAALMIILGYPGEIAGDNTTRAIWGTLSAVPFVYIVWQLFSGLGEAIERQPAEVRGLVKQARLLTFASWGFYPIVYMAPYAQISGPQAETIIQLGYTLADLIAKCVVGVLVYNIAVRKSALETA